MYVIFIAAYFLTLLHSELIESSNNVELMSKQQCIMNEQVRMSNDVVELKTICVSGFSTNVAIRSFVSLSNDIGNNVSQKSSSMNGQDIRMCVDEYNSYQNQLFSKSKYTMYSWGGKLHIVPNLIKVGSVIVHELLFIYI